MVSDQECPQEEGESLLQEDEQKEEEDSQLNQEMTKLLSLKKNSHFETVLKNRVINNDLFSIYRVKNFIEKKNSKKNLYISFVMRKKVGNAVKRNRIKRKLKSIVQKLVKMNNLINLNYTYVILGKEKAYKELHDSLFEKMQKSFKRIDGIKL